MPKKLTYDFIKEYIENKGCILISTKYINSKTKLKIKCNNGHEYKVKWNDFYNNIGCPECYNKKRSKLRKLTYEFVKEQIEKEGYELLSTEYKGANYKLKIKCNKGHEYEVSYGSFKYGSRCLKCYNKKRGKSQKLTYEFVKEQIEKEGYELLSNRYVNYYSKLKVKCDKGHEYKVSCGNFYSGNRCPICSGKKKHLFSYIKREIEKEGYKLLSNRYVNSHSKLKMKCNKGHEYEMRWYDFQQGRRCPICYAQKTSSKTEKEIAEYVKSFDLDIIKNDRTKIFNGLTNKYLELDIFIPELNKAIEFNGTYWHSNKYSKIKDGIKVNQCKKNGIDLLVINEKDWIKNKKNCLNTIRDFIVLGM